MKSYSLPQFLLIKAGQFLFSILGASSIIFFIVQLTPGNIAEIHNLSENTAAQFHLHKPLIVQYFYWLGGCFQLDFSVSLTNGDRVLDLVHEYMGTSLVLAAGSLLISLLLSVPLAVLLGLSPDSKWGKWLSTLIYGTSSIPVFVVGYIALAIVFGVFKFYPLDTPVGDFNFWPWMAYYVLPIMVLAMGNGTLGEFVRVLTLEIRSVNKSLYIKAARSRGASLIKHFFKPVFIPFLSVVISRFAVLIGGVVVVERIFNRRGLGWLTWEATLNRDFYVIMSVTLMMAVTIRFLLFIHELLTYLLDPRMRNR